MKTMPQQSLERFLRNRFPPGRWFSPESSESLSVPRTQRLHHSLGFRGGAVKKRYTATVFLERAQIPARAEAPSPEVYISTQSIRTAGKRALQLIHEMLPRPSVLSAAPVRSQSPVWVPSESTAKPEFRAQTHSCGQHFEGPCSPT